MEKNVALVKKSSILAFSAILVFSLIVGAQSVSLVSANGIPAPPINRSYIRSNGTVEPSTLPIKRDGNIYIFTKKIFNYTIEVQRDNIVIDGAGFSLQGLSSHFYAGITLSNRRNVTIKDININQFGWCIRIKRSSNITIMENRMSGAYGVALSSSDNNQITENSIIECSYGVKGSGSFNNIFGNNFTDSGCIIAGDYNTISENLFKDEASISLGGEYGSKNNTISNNIMVGGEGNGIRLGPRSPFNIVFGNNITGKTKCGIRIDCTYNNTVYDNYLANNGFGIYIGNPAFPHTKFSNSKYNTFYRNRLVNNTENVHIEKPIRGGLYPNFWDNGKEGNYWSDYNGTDANDDGVGDTPYIIAANNVDRYPFSEKEPFPTTMVIAPFASVAFVGVGLLVYLKKRKR